MSRAGAIKTVKRTIGWPVMGHPISFGVGAFAVRLAA